MRHINTLSSIERENVETLAQIEANAFTKAYIDTYEKTFRSEQQIYFKAITLIIDIASTPIKQTTAKLIADIRNEGRTLRQDAQAAYDALNPDQRTAVEGIATKTDSNFSFADKEIYDVLINNQKKYFKAITGLITTIKVPVVKIGDYCKGKKEADGSYRALTENEIALMNAAKNDQHRTLEGLLDKKLCPNIHETTGGRNENWTPLHWAAFRGHENVVEKLLDSGADVNSRNSSRDTALHLAASNGHIEAARKLIQRIADYIRKY